MQELVRTPSRKASHLYGMKMYIFMLLVLPASSFTELKILAFGVAGAEIFFWIFKKRANKKDIEVTLLWALFWAALLILFLLLGQVIHSDSEYDLRAAVSYAGFVGSFFLIIVAVRSGILSFEDLFKTIVIASLIYNSLKIILITLPVIGVISVRDLKTLLDSFIGSAVMEFWSEDAVIARISLGNDILAPFVAAFLLMGRVLTSGLLMKWRSAIAWILIISSALSFTRYIWMLDLFVICGYALLRAKKGAAIFLVLLFIGAIFASLQNIDWFADIVSTRAGDVTSIDVKNEQAGLLLQELEKYPFLGKGLGGYLTNYTRSEYQPYLYEVQWLALGMQIGIIGVLLLFWGMLGVVLGRRRRRISGLIDIYFFILYAMWLGSGLFNPYLLIMSSSVIYIMFLFYFKPQEDIFLADKKSAI